MPKNKKEKIFFTLIMASLMVFGMTVYNLILNNSQTADLVHEMITGYPLGLLVALFFDFLLIGPIVEMLVFKLIIPKYEIKKDIMVGITMSTLMVIGMVSCMSLFGVFINGYSILHYPLTWILNLCVALPLQLLIVGPFARKILSSIQK